MNKKKLLGALLSGGISIIYFGTLLFIFTSLGINTKDIPLPIFILIVLFLLMPLIGIIIALISRIKEISNGEEEQAKKY